MVHRATHCHNSTTPTRLQDARIGIEIIMATRSLQEPRAAPQIFRWTGHILPSAFSPSLDGGVAAPAVLLRANWQLVKASNK